MFGKLSKNSSVKRILVISLSNIGDVVLTCPVMDVLLRDFPQAQLSLVVSEKAASLFTDHPQMSTVVYNKHLPLWGQIYWFQRLWRQSYDVIVDFRQSAMGLFLRNRWRTPVGKQQYQGHMRFKHFERLKTVYPEFAMPTERLTIHPKPVHRYWGPEPYVVMAPGAADSLKRWPPSGFVAVAHHLTAMGYQIVFVGDRDDAVLVDAIARSLKVASVSLAGKTDLRETAHVLQHCAFAITHDSGTMHLASYFDVPTVALWGPTDVNRYGPWSKKAVVVYRGKHMSSIEVQDVIHAVGQMS